MHAVTEICLINTIEHIRTHGGCFGLSASIENVRDPDVSKLENSRIQFPRGRCSFGAAFRFLQLAEVKMISHYVHAKATEIQR